MTTRMTCYLEIQFSSIDKLMIYHVRAEVWDRLQAVLENMEQIEDEFCFFSFDTEDGRAVSVSLSDIQFLKYTMNPDVNYYDDNPRKGITLYFRDRILPVTSSIDEASDAFFLEAKIVGALKEDSFLSYVDQNGDRCSFNVAHLVLMELQTAQIMDGENKSDLPSEGESLF